MCCNIAACKPGSAKVTMMANQALLREIAHALVGATEPVMRADGAASTSSGTSGFSFMDGRRVLKLRGFHYHNPKRQ